MKYSINRLLAKLNIRIVSNKRQGMDLANDIKRADVDIATVFDVGANRGQSSKYFLQQFRSASVHAFEPVSDNFTILSQKSNERLTVNKVALSDEVGEVKIFLHRNDAMHSTIVVEDQSSYEIVQCKTIDQYCQENAITRIGLLKIDTEGADLRVLAGSLEMISKGRVDFVFVESAFYSSYRHVFIGDFLRFFSEHEFSVLGVYDQSLEWNQEARIQYANILFARKGIKCPRLN